MDDAPLHPPSDNAAPEIFQPTRRQAVTTLGAGVALTVAGVTLPSLAGCGVRKPAGAAITSGLVSVGNARDYPAGKASTEYMANYGIVITNDSGTLLAIRPKCTHMGCIAPWNASTGQFECPCHGSRFNILGQPTHGPAQRPLVAVNVQTTANGTLAVDLDKLYAQPS